MMPKKRGPCSYRLQVMLRHHVLTERTHSAGTSPQCPERNLRAQICIQPVSRWSPSTP